MNYEEFIERVIAERKPIFDRLLQSHHHVEKSLTEIPHERLGIIALLTVLKEHKQQIDLLSKSCQLQQQIIERLETEIKARASLPKKKATSTKKPKTTKKTTPTVKHEPQARREANTQETQN